MNVLIIVLCGCVAASIGLGAVCLYDAIAYRLRWWQWRSPLPPASRSRLDRAARANRPDITAARRDRTWVGQERHDDDGAN
jgi:hypothetical protein